LPPVFHKGTRRAKAANDAERGLDSFVTIENSAHRLH